MRRLTSILLTAGLSVAALAAAPVVAASAAAGGPIAGTTGLFVNPGSPSATWVATHPADPRTPGIQAAISSRPMARWFTGTSDSDIGAAVAKYAGTAVAAGNKLPVLVAYNIPGRDACGGQSAGGARTPAEYHQWISTFAAAIAGRPAIVILEPDSLGDFSCMTAAQISARNEMLNYATEMFTQKAPNTWTYLDAANQNWTTPATIAARLWAAGLAKAHGFAVNVSNYNSTSTSQQYAEQVKSALGAGPGYVIDTSRNGNGYNGEWCNPAGRKLGTSTIADPAALQLWIKNPGNSDGLCGIAPTTPAGTFDPDLAEHLITGE